uniref:BTB domain-containing protein n=1 Tax=Panagrolaimus davidi TaxID=227884 RepID=A0A914PC35_9BILA
MFESGAIENKMIIKEEDFSVEVVDAAFNIYYNLNFPQNFAFENMLSAYKFADKYDIKFIINHLEEYLIKNISTSNVCQLEKFSTDFNVTELHQSCVDFLIKCLQENIPILGADSLEKDFVFSLFLKTLSPVVETDTNV